MTAPRPPVLARIAVALAVAALRGAEDRERYRAEFLAELHDLQPAQQLWHCAGLVSRSFALRAALGASPSRGAEGAMTLPITATPFWRCRVLRWHTWVSRSTDDGGRYETCGWCGVDRGPAARGMMSTPPWPGDIR